MNTQNQKRNVLVLVLVIFSIYIAAYGVKLPASIRGAFHSALSGLGYDLSGHTGFAREVGSSTVDFKTKDLTASGSGWFDGDVHVGGNILASVGSLINNHAGLSSLDFPSSGHTGFASSGAIPGNGSFTLNGLSEKNYTNLTNKPTSASWTLNGLSEKSYSSLTDTPTNASYTLNGLAEKNYDNLTNKPTSASWTLAGLFEKAYSSLTNKPDSASWTHDLLTGVSAAIGHDSRYYQVASYDNFRIDSGELTGFVDQTSTSIAFVDGTRTFTITGTNFPVWSKGLRYLKNTESVTLSIATATTYIYYSASQAIATSTSVWSFSDGSVPIAIVYFDGQYGKVQDERHGIQMDGKTHEYIHVTIGTRFASGLAGTFNDTLATITSGIIYDEDLRHVIPQQTTFPCFYRMGSNFKFTSAQSKYYVENANVLRYDNGGVPTDVTNNNYMAMWFFATADPITPIWCMVGQREDNTLALARTNNTFESLSLSTLPVPEIKVLYRVILKRSGTSELFQEATDFRNTTNLPTQNYVSTDHGVLSGLLDDDHSQYLNLLGRGGQTINDFIQALYYDFDTASSTNPAYKAGRLFYDVDNKTLALYPDVNGPILQLGQEMWIRAKNNTGIQINDGQAVYISSATTGIHPNAQLAIANATSTANVIAIATHNIPDGQFGYFTLSGIVRTLDTSSYTPGTCLYLSQVTPGAYSSTPPNSGISVSVGHVTMSHATEGAIFVRPSINGSLEKAYFANGLSVNGAASATMYYGDGSNLTGIVSGVSSFSSLNDVSTDTGNIGKFLKMSGNKTYTWDTASGSTGVSLFSGLTDVSTNTTNIGKVLSMSGDKAYSWIDQASGTPTSGSGTPVVSITGASVATTSALILTNSNTSYMTVGNNDAMAFEIYIKAKHDLGYSGGRLAGVLKNASGAIAFVETGYEKLSCTDSTKFSFIASYTNAGQLIVVASSPSNLTVTGWAMTTNFSVSLTGGSGVSYLKDLLDVSSSSANIGKSLYMVATNTYGWQDTFYSLPATLSCFIATLTTAQSISINTLTKVTFNSKSNDNFNEFSTSSNSFTAAKSYSKYLFRYGVTSPAIQSAFTTVQLYVNGVAYEPSYSIRLCPTSANMSNESSVVVSLNAGDIVDCRYTQNSGAVALVNAKCSFSGYEIPDATTVVQSTAQAVQTYVDVSGATSIPNSALTSPTVISLNTEAQDSLNEFSTSSYWFQPSSDGDYLVSGYADMTFTTAGFPPPPIMLLRFVDSTAPSTGLLTGSQQGFTSTFSVANLSGVLRLSSTKKYQLTVAQNSGYTYTCNGRLNIRKIPSTDIIPTIAHVNTTEVTVIASSASNLSIANSVETQITGLTSDINLYSEFSGATFTANVAQKVMVNCGIVFAGSSAGSFRYFALHKNGVRIAWDQKANPSTSLYLPIAIQREISLNTGDKLTLHVMHDTGSSLNVNSSFFQIIRLNTSVTDLASLGGADVLLIASRSTTLSIPTGNWNPVTGLGEDIDAYGEFSGATFTSRCDQIVQVNANVEFANTNSTGDRELGVLKNYNGTNAVVSQDLLFCMGAMSTTNRLSASKVFKLKAGNTLTFLVSQSSGVSINLNAASIQIVRLNPPGTTYQTTSSVVGFSAKGSTQGFSSGTPTNMIFPTEDFDMGGGYDPATGVFTAPSSGIYLGGINLNSNMSISGTAIYLFINKNGGNYQRFTHNFPSNTYNNTTSISFSVFLNAGETINLQIATTAGSTFGLQGYPYTNTFYMHKVSQ